MKRKLFVFVLVTTGLVLAACGPSGATPDASGQIILVQEDDEGGMSFNPESIVLTAGETVTIVLENHGAKDHEFMIGKEVIYNESGAPMVSKRISFTVGLTRLKSIPVWVPC